MHAGAMQSVTQEKHSEEKVQELEQVRLCCIAVRLFMFIIRSVRMLKSFGEECPLAGESQDILYV